VAFFYLADRKSLEDLRAQISRIKQFRWMLYIAGMSLWLFCLLDQRFGSFWPFGTVLIGTSAGLSLPHAWVKKRLAQSEEQPNILPGAAFRSG
jgi:hypothetical protein